MSHVSPALDDLEGVLDRTREIAASVLAPHAEATDRDAVWVERQIRALQEAGLGGLVVPVEHGGLGHGLSALARVCELLGRECASSALSFGMHCVGAAVIAAKPTDDQIVRYLEPIAAGTHLTTLTLSEPGSGAHFYIPQTETADADDAHFRVRGAKTFVTNGSHADSYVLSVVTPGAAGTPGEFSCLILDGATEGLGWGEPWHGLGMRGNDSRNLALRDVLVPRANLLGERGDEIWYVFNVIAPYFLVAMAGTYLGVAAAALDEVLSHLTTRRYTTTGGTLSEQPVLQHRVGELWATVERTRQLVYFAAGLGDSGSPDALPALASAKAEVAEAAVRVTNEALTLVGGIGYRESAKLGRMLRDARAASVMAPTTDILRTWTGRAVLGRPLLSD